MGLRWSRKERCGEIVYKNGITHWWCECNACMVVMDEQNNLHWFAIGVDHLRNLFGLSKDWKENHFCGDSEIVRLTINRHYCSGWAKLIPVFVKAFPGIEIVTYEDETPERKHTLRFGFGEGDETEFDIVDGTAERMIDEAMSLLDTFFKENNIDGDGREIVYVEEVYDK